MRIFKSYFFIFFLIQMNVNLNASSMEEQFHETQPSNTTSIDDLDFTRPTDALQIYFGTHSFKGQSTWEDVGKLKTSIINSITDDKNERQEYSELHENLSQKLKNNLILARYQETSWRTVDFLAASMLGATNLTVILGVSNIISDMPAIGYSQIASAILGAGATTIQYPYFRNWLYKPKNGKLLYSSHGEDEIAIQSQLIALIAISNNSDNALKLNQKKSLYKRFVTKTKLHDYADQLSHYILSNFKFESNALISCVDLDETSRTSLPEIRI